MALNWTMIGGQVECYEHPSDTCHVTVLAESSMRMDFHDDTLASATSKINQILNEARAKRADKDLRFITTPDGLMLAWARCGDAVSPESDPALISKALGLVKHA